MQEARKYPGEENKVIEFYQKNPEAANAVRAPLFEEKVVDHIISKCSIKELIFILFLLSIFILILSFSK